MQVVVNVAQVFWGKGKLVKRYRRGDLVEVEGKVVPKWAHSIAEAKKKAAVNAPVPKEPETLSEMNAQTSSKPQKAFGQEI